MKDRQGVMRGKCNECDECQEYVKPSEGARCDYCDHVPTQHVMIIKLGVCKKCSECEEYMSEDKFSYTDCEYCGCKPSDHKGAEKLRKKPPPSPASSSVSTTSKIGPTQATPVSGRGQTCKMPGCDRPCFTEGGKTHEFCGRTHAQEYKKIAPQSPMIPVIGGPPLSSNSSLPIGPPPSFDDVMSTSPSQPTVSSSLFSSFPSAVKTTAMKMCFECKFNPANPGYNICQKCYVHRNS